MTITLLWTGLVVALLVLRRFRHLIVLVVATELVVALDTVCDRVGRPASTTVRGEIQTSWGGWAMPSAQISALAAALVGVLYTLVPAGRWRTSASGRRLGWWPVGVARMALGVEAPTDVLVGVAMGVTIPLVGFRLFTPDESSRSPTGGAAAPISTSGAAW